MIKPCSRGDFSRLILREMVLKLPGRSNPDRGIFLGTFAPSARSDSSHRRSSPARGELLETDATTIRRAESTTQSNPARGESSRDGTHVANEGSQSSPARGAISRDSRPRRAVGRRKRQLSTLKVRSSPARGAYSRDDMPLIETALKPCSRYGLPPHQRPKCTWTSRAARDPQSRSSPRTTFWEDEHAFVEKMPQVQLRAHASHRVDEWSAAPAGMTAWAV
jgi:hypothetical protein